MAWRALEKASMKKILIAGIGNIFHGDDGFGCETVRELTHRTFPDGVTVRDFGIRSYDLAYALTNGYDTAILVDAVSHKTDPGTVYLIEPDLNRLDGMQTALADAHTTSPITVLQMAKSLGKISRKVFLVGCEPAVLENDSGEIGLSPQVKRAVPAAVELIESFVGELISESRKETAPVST